MSKLQIFKRTLKYIFKGIPINYVTAQVVTLAPNQLLKGKVALITGGTSGIGFHIAKAFLDSGASVCITGRNISKVNETCEKLKAHSSDYSNRVYGIELDNKNISSFELKIKDILKYYEKIDILVNNAGVVGGEIATVTEDTYDNILDTNLKGMFFLSKEIGKYMKAKCIKGNILNIASSSSLRPAASAYTLTKWGTRGLTLGLAKTLAPYGITVNGIAPGPTATPMLGKNDGDDLSFPDNPLGRFALPEEIANMAVYLVSSMGRTIVGDIVYMTGGSGLITFDDVSYNF